MAAPKRLSRRAFLRTLAATVAAVGLAACAPETTRPGPQPRGVVQLVYQDWRTDWFPSMARSALDDFHAKHPTIRVFYTPDPDDVGEKMLVDFNAGTAPDVFAGCCDFLPLWAQKGHLLDLGPYVAADLDRATLADWDLVQYRALFTRSGIQFALPKYHGALALYYNKDLFDRKKVPYPEDAWNHDDYHEAMKRLAGDNDGDGKIDVWGSMTEIAWERIQVHVNGWGGRFVDPVDATHSVMDSPAALAAMHWLRSRIWDDHTMASPLDVQNMAIRQAFLQQKVAMVEDGSWGLKELLENATFRVGVAAFPAGPVRKVTLATTDGFGINAGTKHPDAAWELLKFLISRDYGRAMARAHFLQPARASLVDEWVRLVRQSYPAKTEGMNIAVFADGHLKGYSVTAEIFPNMEGVGPLVLSAWQQIFILGRAPVESMQAVSTKISQLQRGSR